MSKKFLSIIGFFLFSCLPSVMVHADVDPGQSQSATRSFSVGETALHSAFFDESEIMRLWEFLPSGSNLETWTRLASVIQYKFPMPVDELSQSMMRIVKEAGGAVIGFKHEGGGAVLLAFVMHDPADNFSEINIWRYFQRNGESIGNQIAYRYYGEHHEESAKMAVQKNMSRWVKEMRNAEYPDVVDLLQLED